MSLVLLLSVVSGAAAAPTSFTGTLSTPQVSADGGAVTAQITVSVTCDPASYCGFFPVLTTVPATQACSDVITGSGWVGTLISAPYGSNLPTLTTSASASWSEFPSLANGAKHACLYAETGSGPSVLVAQADYVVPAPTATPGYVPPGVAPSPTVVPTVVPPPAPAAAPQFLSRTEAVATMRSWLKRKYGNRWTKGRRRTVQCPVRTSDAQLGCFGVWVYGRHALSRIAVITETEDSYIFSKDFLSAPSQDGAPGSTSDAAGDDFCATHVCIPNYGNGTGSTVQCSDGTYSHSGGKQGACSHHGGIARAVRRAAARAMTNGAQQRLASALGTASAHPRP